MSKFSNPRRVTRITCQLLSMLEKEESISQRQLAGSLGIALGATNAYVRKCIASGWIIKKSSQGYQLTGLGKSWKSRLLARQLRNNLNAYNTLRADILNIMKQHELIYVAGTGYLAEIAMLCALEIDGHTNRIIGFYSPSRTGSSFMGKPVYKCGSELADNSDTPLLFTCIKYPEATYKELTAEIKPSRILIPQSLLELVSYKKEEI